MKVGIVGAGPGGLMTARLLEQKCGAACATTVFEASDRVGGKLHTRKFSTADAAYESGVANVVDPLGGSYFLENLTTRFEREILAVVDEVGRSGGTVKLIERGWFQRRIADFAYETARAKSAGTKSIFIIACNLGRREKPKQLDREILVRIRLRLGRRARVHHDAHDFFPRRLLLAEST